MECRSDCTRNIGNNPLDLESFGQMSYIGSHLKKEDADFCFGSLISHKRGPWSVVHGLWSMARGTCHVDMERPVVDAFVRKFTGYMCCPTY